MVVIQFKICCFSLKRNSAYWCYGVVVEGNIGANISFGQFKDSFHKKSKHFSISCHYGLVLTWLIQRLFPFTLTLISQSDGKNQGSVITKE